MRSARREALCLLALALPLRLIGLGFGLPGIAHDDEWYYVAQAATTLERGSPLADVGPDELPYISPTATKLLCVLAVAPVDAWLKGGLPGGEGTRLRYRTHRGAFHVAGRLAVALVGVAGVLLTWGAARALCGPRAGLTAGALLALSPLHVRDSHFAATDVPLATCVAGLALLLARGPAPGRAGRWGAGLGAWLGAAGATKYSAGLLLLPAGLALWLRPPASARVRASLSALGAAGAVFLLLFPAALLDTSEVLRSFRGQAALSARPWPGQDAPAEWAAALVPVTPSGALVLETLLRALGPVGLGLALLGAARVAWRRPELVCLLPVWLLFFARTPLFAARFLLPLLPLLAVCAGASLVVLRGRRGAQALLVTLALVPPALHSVRVVTLLQRTDTRVDFLEWTRAALTGGELEGLALDAGLVRYLPLGPDGRHDPRLARARPVTVLLRGEQGLAPAQLEQLHQAGYDHLAFSDTYLLAQPNQAELLAALERLGTLVLDASPAAPKRAGPGREVPRSLEEHLAPWRHAFARARPGPRVRVYRLSR